MKKFPEILESPIPLYTNGDNDQPITCPQCGDRTEIVTEIDDKHEHHRCPGCDYEFVMIYDED